MIRQAWPLARQAVSSPIGRRSRPQWPAAHSSNRALQVHGILYGSSKHSADKLLCRETSQTQKDQTPTPSRVYIALIQLSSPEVKAVRQPRPNLHLLDRYFLPRLLPILTRQRPQDRLFLRKMSLLSLQLHPKVSPRPHLVHLCPSRMAAPLL